MNIPFVNAHTHKPDPHALCLVSLRLGAQDAIPGRLLTPAAPSSSLLWSAGVHPWDAEHFDKATLNAILVNLNASSNIAAIGETGLDYACGVDRTMQKSVFRAQLELAAHRQLPVIIHCVRALDDILGILSEYTLPCVVFHGFIGNYRQLLEVTDKGHSVSFGPAGLRSPKTVEAMRRTPTDRLLLETDDSQAGIAEIYDSAAHILGMRVEELAEITYSNFKKITG